MSSSALPKDHPRYASLMQRHALEDGLAAGITTPTGLIAHGRGEALDYFLDEKSHPFAFDAARAAAARLLLAKHAVISINGNTAVLVPNEMCSLAVSCNAKLEVNLFYDSQERREKIAAAFLALGQTILGVSPNAEIPGLSSPRANVDAEGIQRADVVLVSLEDGDRTEALRKAGKLVIAIDLNPLSRTAQMADITIVDNIVRALPMIEQFTAELRGQSPEALQAVLNSYNHGAVLEAAECALRSGST